MNFIITAIIISIIVDVFEDFIQLSKDVRIHFLIHEQLEDTIFLHSVNALSYQFN